MLSVDITKVLHGAAAEKTLSVSLKIAEGSFVALSGVSGSGKTTLLRILAGLEESEGSISFGENIWLDHTYTMPPQKRNIGMLFQSYALFPHMSVEENLLYVSRDKALAEELMEMTGMTALRRRKPQSLSGGQQQRAALCRAMMRRPRLLLLDEPLSALDPVMRSTLQQEILALHRRFNTTTLMVSHEPSEIYRMAERVIVLSKGEVVADGSPRDLLLHTSGSQKFSFEGELLEILRVDVITVAIVAIGQQIVEIVLSPQEAARLQIGDKVNISTKAFAPTISHSKKREKNG